jgi:hypothetical protein
MRGGVCHVCTCVHSDKGAAAVGRRTAGDDSRSAWQRKEEEQTGSGRNSRRTSAGTVARTAAGPWRGGGGDVR